MPINRPSEGSHATVIGRGQESADRTTNLPTEMRCLWDAKAGGRLFHEAVYLEHEALDLQSLIDLARQEPVLLLAPDGSEFVQAEADDFDQEVEALRASPAFQRFLDERSKSTRRIPLEEIEAEIERELAVPDS